MRQRLDSFDSFSSTLLTSLREYSRDILEGNTQFCKAYADEFDKANGSYRGLSEAPQTNSVVETVHELSASESDFW